VPDGLPGKNAPAGVLSRGLDTQQYSGDTGGHDQAVELRFGDFPASEMISILADEALLEISHR
jgi:hypothetical protein